MDQAPNLALMPLSNIAARLARFEERVDAAQRSNPPTKQWVRDALRGKGASRCPVRLKRTSLDLIVQHGDLLADLFTEFPDDAIGAIPYEICIGHQPPGKKERVDPIAALTRSMEWTDEWGVRWGHTAGGVGATPVGYPLRDWTQLDEYLVAGIPDPCSPGRLDPVRPLFESHSQTKYVFGIVHLALFERLHALRGMDATFIDLVDRRAEVERLLDALQAYLLELIGYWAAIGADAVFLTDDFGSQNAIMMSPRMWREVFKPRYRALVAATHDAGMDFILHSCGCVTAILEDLAEIGVDVLDPIQPGAMDIDEVAAIAGGAMAFSGGIDVQHLLADGSPAEVKDGIRRLVARLARPFGNRLLLCPANVMTPEVPPANLRAMFEGSRDL
jgi:uroporphyrinogen decarboxylase